MQSKLKVELGQVWTPKDISGKMAQLVKPFVNHSSKILDPAAGPGTFIQAFIAEQVPFEHFLSCEIDLTMEFEYQSLPESVSHTLTICDYLTYISEEEVDAVIINPPYIRHELLTKQRKEWLAKWGQANQFSFSARMNFFGYFLLKASAEMKIGGILCAIIYDSIDNTTYGKQLTTYLGQRGDFLYREKVAAPFDGVIVDAEILLWQKGAVTSEYQDPPSDKLEKGWCRIDDLSKVKRGTSFPNRKNFVFPLGVGGELGLPLVTKLGPSEGLFATPNSKGLFRPESPAEFQRENSISVNDNQGSYPRPVKAPILFNYFFRDTPRHILNRALIAASDNFYCVTPNDTQLSDLFWFLANSPQFERKLYKYARKQGSGLFKLQLFEYKALPFPDYRIFSQEEFAQVVSLAKTAADGKWDRDTIQREAGEFLERLGL